MTAAPAALPTLQSETEEAEIGRVARLLGGLEILGHEVTTPLEAHELLSEGLPGTALHHLVASFETPYPPESLESAFGLSLRTLQRSRADPKRPLSLDQSGRTWKFAEILARATDIFGSQADAERWLVEPATGLDRHRPIDLLSTPAGVEVVETFLRRLEYGVYM